MAEYAMDETIKIGKSVCGYYENNKDYIAPREITVTITLGEYRELVSKNASNDKTISEIKENYEDRIKKLNEELNFFKMQIERMKETVSQTSDDETEDD